MLKAYLFDDKGEKIQNAIMILEDEDGGDLLLVGRNVIAAYFPEFGGLFIFHGSEGHMEYIKQFLCMLGLEDEGALEQIKSEDDMNEYLVRYQMAEYIPNEYMYGHLFE